MDVLGNRNLIVAIVQGNITNLYALLKEPGVQVNEPDQFGSTPLMWAVAKEDLEVVNKLIEYGAKLQLTNRFGDTVLIEAAFGGDDNIVNALIDAIYAR